MKPLEIVGVLHGQPVAVGVEHPVVQLRMVAVGRAAVARRAYHFDVFVGVIVVGLTLEMQPCNHFHVAVLGRIEIPGHARLPVGTGASLVLVGDVVGESTLGTLGVVAQHVDIGQVVVVLKGGCLDLFHALGDGDAAQFRALGKGFCADDAQRIGQPYGLDAGPEKRTRAYLGDAFGQHNVL